MNQSLDQEKRINLTFIKKFIIFILLRLVINQKSNMIMLKRHSPSDKKIAISLVLLILVSLFAPRMILCQDIKKGHVGLELESQSCCNGWAFWSKRGCSLDKDGSFSLEKRDGDECKDFDISIHTLGSRTSSQIAPCSATLNYILSSLVMEEPIYLNAFRKSCRFRDSFPIPTHKFLSTTILLN